MTIRPFLQKMSLTEQYQKTQKQVRSLFLSVLVLSLTNYGVFDIMHVIGIDKYGVLL